MSPLRYRSALALFAAIALASLASTAEARRPPAPRVLPDNTVLYFRITDVPQLIERFNESATGQIAKEPQLQPFLEHLYGAAREAMADAEQEVGTTLPDVLRLPQGEMALAIVARDAKPPAGILLIDLGEDRRAADALLERVHEALEEEGATREEVKAGDVTLAVYHDAGEEDWEMVEVQKEETLVLCSDRDVAIRLLETWNGGEHKTLAENPNYASAVNRVRPDRSDPPQVVFFVDPIALARAVSVGNTGAQFGLALLPTLGLDGVKGVAGSITLATEQYDQVTHLHLALDNPRKGVIDAIAIEPGESKPESWVSADVAEYTTLHWNVRRTYDAVTTLVDGLQGEGTVANVTQRQIGENLGVDFEKDLIDAIEGRMTIAVRYERPATIFSRTPLVAVKLKDPEAFEKTLAGIFEKFPERVETASFGGVTYYHITPRRRNRNPEAGGDAEPENAERNQGNQGDEDPPRRRRPSFAVVEGYLMFSDRATVLEHAIATAGGSGERLADALEYRLIASKIRRQPGGKQAALLNFNRSDEAMRYVYELATSTENRDRLRAASENNPGLRTLLEALEAGELPPYSAFERFLAPGGAMITSDETGLHYMAFTLRRKPEAEEAAP